MTFQNKEKIYVLIIILLLGIAGQFWYSFKHVPLKEKNIEVYYNQRKQLNTQIVKLIREADKFVYFAVYTFTRADIKDALLEAKKKDLDVKGITDKDQIARIESQKKIYEELKEAGIPVLTQQHSGIMHLKVLITDKAFASGSYNWTASATDINDEVLEISHDLEMRDKYLEIFKDIYNQNE